MSWNMGVALGSELTLLRKAVCIVTPAYLGSDEIVQAAAEPWKEFDMKLR